MKTYNYFINVYLFEINYRDRAASRFKTIFIGSCMTHKILSYIIYVQGVHRIGVQFKIIEFFFVQHAYIYYSYNYWWKCLLKHLQLIFSNTLNHGSLNHSSVNSAWNCLIKVKFFDLLFTFPHKRKFKVVKSGETGGSPDYILLRNMEYIPIHLLRNTEYILIHLLRHTEYIPIHLLRNTEHIPIHLLRNTEYIPIHLLRNFSSRNPRTLRAEWQGAHHVKITLN